jgi:uncharacterized protein YjbK
METQMLKGSNERYRRLAGNQFMWRVEGMKIKQGRIKENNPDKAAMKIREMYNEYEGNLSLKRVPWLVGVIEYQIELRG